MHQHKGQRQKQGHRQGFELIEILISLGIVSTLLIIVMALRTTTQLQENTYNTTVARQLIVEEYEALRNSSFATLTANTGAANLKFLEVAYNIGNWAVSTPSVACASCTGGGSKAITVSNASGTNDPSTQVVPDGRLGDGTYETYFRVQNSSPSGWKTGIYFRYHDASNYYFAQVTATQLQLYKNVRGTISAVSPAASVSVAKNTWYKLSVTATGSAITLTLGATSQAYTDTTYTSGQFVLGAMAGATVDFDDVKFTNAGSGLSPLLWSFNTSGDVVASFPAQWRRTGPSTLTSGTTSLTITDYVNGGTTYTDLKSLKLTVSWQERTTTHSVTNTFYLNQQNMAQ